MGRKRKIKKIKNKKAKIVVDQNLKQTTYKTKTFKNNDIKIKKITKQPTEKRVYNVKDYVVYPKHGIGKIIAIEKAKIGNIDINYYKFFIDKDKLTLDSIATSCNFVDKPKP